MATRLCQTIRLLSTAVGLALFALVISGRRGVGAQAQEAAPVMVDTVIIENGDLHLRALLWRPRRDGPFPAVLFNHGSGPADVTLAADRMALGPLFARKGYAFLFLFRRGSGLSATEGENSYDVMARARSTGGSTARNAEQLRLLETDDLGDAISALAYLRARPEVDATHIAVAGHSFGGSLTLLLAERDSAIRAAVVFGGAAGSWEGSPELRARLIAAIRRATAPIFLAYAENDYSVGPATVLGAELQRLNRPHRVRIYPPVGRTPAEGHDLVHRGVSFWETDVFGFLGEVMPSSSRNEP